METSIFTKIVNGEIPSHKVYEDEKTFAFMDIHPKQQGQIVVVPKVQVDFVWDLETADYIALMTTVQKVGKALRVTFPNKARVGIMIEGLEVDNHAHVVVLPFNDSLEFHAPPDENEPDHEKLAKLAMKIKENI